MHNQMFRHPNPRKFFCVLWLRHNDHMYVGSNFPTGTQLIIQTTVGMFTCQVSDRVVYVNGDTRRLALNPLTDSILNVEVGGFNLEEILPCFRVPTDQLATIDRIVNTPLHVTPLDDVLDHLCDFDEIDATAATNPRGIP
jgi:hypothetical protein